MPAQLLLAAVWEELLFRGLVQGQLLRMRSRWGSASWAGVTGANALTSAAFAAAHLIAHPPLLMPAYFAFSIALGIVRERSGGVVWPLALHAAANLLWWALVVPGG